MRIMVPEDLIIQKVDAFLALFDDHGFPREEFYETIQDYSNQELFKLIAVIFKARPFIHNFQETPFENAGSPIYRFSMIELLLYFMNNELLTGDQVDVLHGLFYNVGCRIAARWRSDRETVGDPLEGIEEEYGLFEKDPRSTAAIEELYDMYDYGRPVLYVLDLYYPWRLIGKLFIKIHQEHSREDAIVFLENFIKHDGENGVLGLMKDMIHSICREIRAFHLLSEEEIYKLERRLIDAGRSFRGA